MKKLILLLTFISLLLGCSSDSNSSTNTNTAEDIDGNIYNTVEIGSQVWMQRNLDVTHYRNGDVIPQVTDEDEWANLTTGAWCYYNNDPANASYGKIYNAYAVHDPRGLAPQGWHVPSQDEINTLIDYSNSLNPFSSQSTLTEIGFNHWYEPNDTSNLTGFTALGSGNRMSNGDPGFDGLKQRSWMWSSTLFPGMTTKTLSFLIIPNFEGCNLGLPNEYGHSVRCIKD
jgi:uncharacterized protein (TIGR02145 family)